MSIFMCKPKAKGDAGVQADGNEDADLAALDDPEDVDEDDLEAEQEADQAREDADNALLDDMANNNVDLALTAEHIKEGRLTIEKVSYMSSDVRVVLINVTGDKAFEESLE